MEQGPYLSLLLGLCSDNLSESKGSVDIIKFAKEQATLYILTEVLYMKQCPIYHREQSHVQVRTNMMIKDRIQFSSSQYPIQRNISLPGIPIPSLTTNPNCVRFLTDAAHYCLWFVVILITIHCTAFFSIDVILQFLTRRHQQNHDVRFY